MRLLRVFAGGDGEVRSLLSYALRAAYGLDRLPEMARLPGGKPYFPSAPHIRFSLSHSGALALCAVGDGEVGADIEAVRPRAPGLPRFALTPGEFSDYLNAGGTWEAFYALWTRKEAWCKYTGEGLGWRPARLSVPESGIFVRGYAGEGWRCAVCALEPPPGLEWAEGYASS